MPDVFARLKELSAHLNESSDALNQAITKLEEQFGSLRLGVEVWLHDNPVRKETEVDHDAGVGYDVITTLGYAKPQGKWGLWLCHFYDGPDHYEYVHLSQAPRTMRIEAIGKLPLLIKKFEKEAEVTLKDVNEARKILESTVGPG